LDLSADSLARFLIVERWSAGVLKCWIRENSLLHHSCTPVQNFRALLVLRG
jgi:hypothetical protein